MRKRRFSCQGRAAKHRRRSRVRRRCDKAAPYVYGCVELERRLKNFLGCDRGQCSIRTNKAGWRSRSRITHSSTGDFEGATIPESDRRRTWQLWGPAGYWESDGSRPRLLKEKGRSEKSPCTARSCTRGSWGMVRNGMGDRYGRQWDQMAVAQ